MGDARDLSGRSDLAVAFSPAPAVCLCPALFGAVQLLTPNLLAYKFHSGSISRAQAATWSAPMLVLISFLALLSVVLVLGVLALLSPNPNAANILRALAELLYGPRGPGGQKPR
jgi:hypothetical protein